MIDILAATRSERLELDREQPLLSALERQGLSVATRVWNDPNVDWTEGRACVLHSCADASPRGAELLAWARKVAAVRPLVNPPAVLEWNLDRSYLRTFDRRDVPTVPTLWLEGGGPLDLAFQLELVGWPAAVVLPARGRGPEQAAVVRLADLEGRADLERILAKDDAILQPYLPHLAVEGIASLVYLEGAFSHAVQRRARSGDSPQAGDTGLRRPLRVGSTEREIADAALALAPRGHLWARVDLVRDAEGEVCVLALELVEPDLDFEYGEGSARRLAVAIAKRLG